MRKIPKSVIATLEEDPRMKKCCLWYLGGCRGRIEWHHNLIYAGRQVNLAEAILGVCQAHHEQANNKEIKERLDWIMLNQFNEAHFEKFPKASLRYRKGFLNHRYGVKREPSPSINR